MKKHENYMKMAIDLALKAKGKTYPNPLVGCVITHNDQVIAKGLHKKAGADHAEKDALKKCKELDVRLNECVLYVNLEPCSHFGRTAPCCDEIIANKIPTVVYGMKDPNPLVAGEGLKKLKQAGIKTIGPVLEKECIQINKVFIKNILNKQTFFSLKSAITIDGMMADYEGASKWITSSDSRQKVHEIRSICDALIVGSSTIVSDDPSLNVRVNNTEVSNQIVILDEKLKVPAHAKVFEKNSSVIIVTSKNNEDQCQSFKKKGVDFIFLDRNQPKFLEQLSLILFEKSICHALVEAGPGVHSLFLDKMMIDQWHLFMAMKTLPQGKSIFSKAQAILLDQAQHFELVSVKQLGQDLYLNLVPVKRD